MLGVGKLAPWKEGWACNQCGSTDVLPKYHAKTPFSEEETGLRVICQRCGFVEQCAPYVKPQPGEEPSNFLDDLWKREKEAV